MTRRLAFFIPCFALLLSSGLNQGCTTAANLGDADPSPSADGPSPTDAGAGREDPSNVDPANSGAPRTGGDKPGDKNNPGGEGNKPEPGDPGADPDCEDGQIDESCHALPDGTPIEFPTGMPLGNCRAGTRVCSGGAWGSCEGAIAPAEKDDCEKKNDDADCDGVPNAGCDCVTGDTRPCGESDVGACKMGKQRCINGKWDTECVDVVYPAKERCDGKGVDEDCDGKADLDDSDCDCIDDTKAYCERPKEKGDCRWGQKTCKAGRWKGCQEWAKPVTELCGQREAVKGVAWTGDEDCDGKIDTSALGKRGPAGCVQMMLDQDGDGWGKIGPDLSSINNNRDINRLGTACLCPDRPDIAEKRAEGWVEATGRKNRDCGDCPPGLGGDLVYPGSHHTSTVGNRCLVSVGWRIRRSGGIQELGDFDLNCDGQHTDPGNRRGEIDVLNCRKTGKFECGPTGNGRLIPKGARGIWCGGTFEFGRCEAITKMEFGDSTEEEAQAPWMVDQLGYSGDDGGGGGATTTRDGVTTTRVPEKKFVRCAKRRSSGTYQIRCQ